MLASLAEPAKPIGNHTSPTPNGQLKPSKNYTYAKKAAEMHLGAQFSSLMAGAFDDSDGEDEELEVGQIEQDDGGDDDRDDVKSQDELDRGDGGEELDAEIEREAVEREIERGDDRD